MNEQYYLRQIKYLCRYGNRNELYDIYNKLQSIPGAIVEYRTILRNRGYGSVCRRELKETYNRRQIEDLHNLFNYMFLQDIPEEDFKFGLERIDNTDDGIDKVYNYFDKYEQQINFITCTINI